MPYCSPQWSILFSVTLLLFVLLLLHFLLLKFGKSGGSVNRTATKALITEAFHVERSNKHKLLGGTRVGVREKEGREASSPCHIWFFDCSAKLALFSFNMSNYRTWQSKQAAFHQRIMVLPFIADSNFKLKTTLYSTKNFSFSHACISMEEAHATYALIVVL